MGTCRFRYVQRYPISPCIPAKAGNQYPCKQPQIPWSLCANIRDTRFLRSQECTEYWGLEETRELAVVTSLADNEQISDYIEKNEFALRYHLSQLDRATNDFDVHYKNLEIMSKAQSRSELNPNKVWDALEGAMHEVFMAIQVLKPAVKRTRPERAKKFSKLRGEILSSLLEVNMEDSFELKEIRNRMVHFDEDFDDWYLKSADKGFRGNLQLTQKVIFFEKVDLHAHEQGVLIGYDVKGGVFHSLGKKIEIHSVCKIMRFLRDCLPSAHDQLTKIAGSRTELKIL